MSLTKLQQDIVDSLHLEGNVIIPAAAAAGKSHCFSYCIKRLIEELEVHPSRIVVTSFSNRGADGLKQKITSFEFNDELQFIGTFHKFAMKALKSYDLMNDSERLWTPEDISYTFLEWIRTKNSSVNEFFSSFDYWFVDEAQDNNALWNEVLLHYKLPGRKILVAGDDQQAIMSFQGSSPEYMRRFQEDFAPCICLPLYENHRSHQGIVDLANEVMGNGETHEYMKRDFIPISTQPKNMARRQRLPELRHVQNQHEAIQQACQEIASCLNRFNDEPSDYAILTKRKDPKHQIRACLLQYGYDSAEPSAILRSTVENGDTKRVVRTTIHDSKGAEFKHVYVLFLDDTIFPDHKADLEEERRVFMVAITRAKESLTIYNNAKRPSTFLLEMSQRGTLTKLFNTGEAKSVFENYVSKHPPVGSKLLAQQAIDQAILQAKENNQTLIPMSEEDEKPFNKLTFDLLGTRRIIFESPKWIAQLNGKSHNILRTEIVPIPIKTNGACDWYQIPPTRTQRQAIIMQAQVETVKLQRQRDETDESHPKRKCVRILGTNVVVVPLDSDEEEQDCNFGQSIESFEEQDTTEEVDEDDTDLDEMKPFSHPEWVFDMCLEHEMRGFLDCFVDRYIQQIRQEYAPIESVGRLTMYTYGGQEMAWKLIKKIEMSGDQKKRLERFERVYKNPVYEWRKALMPIFIMSTNLHLRSHNLSNLLVTDQRLVGTSRCVRESHLQMYSNILDEMAQTIHWLVYGINSPYTGLLDVGWEYQTFYHRHDYPCKQPPLSYMCIGRRVVVIDCSNGECGISQSSLLSCLVYACLEELSHQKPIETVQLYSPMHRRIVTMEIGEWTNQQQFLEFLQQAKRDDIV